MNEPLHFNENGHDFAIITEEPNLAHPEGLAALYERTSPKFKQIGEVVFVRTGEPKEPAVSKLKGQARMHAAK